LKIEALQTNGKGNLVFEGIPPDFVIADQKYNSGGYQQKKFPSEKTGTKTLAVLDLKKLHNGGAVMAPVCVGDELR
jgi:hypothetical protein